MTVKVTETPLAKQRRLASEIKHLVGDGESHASYCDFLRRSPAMSEDCDCGAARSTEYAIIEKAYELACLVSPYGTVVVGDNTSHAPVDITAYLESQS